MEFQHSFSRAFSPKAAKLKYACNRNPFLYGSGAGVFMLLANCSESRRSIEKEISLFLPRRLSS
jgi:hypothetical protein